MSDFADLSPQPFDLYPTDSLATIVADMLDEPDASLKGRAVKLFSAVLLAVLWLREQDMVDLNIAEVRDHLNIKRVIDLNDPSRYPEMPTVIRVRIHNHLRSLPDYRPEMGYKQPKSTFDSHAELEALLTSMLGKVWNRYSTIFPFLSK